MSQESAAMTPEFLALNREIRRKVVEVLNLEDLNPEEIAPDAPLFEGGLGLDSVDILELVVMLDREYGINVEGREVGEKVFVTLATMTQYVLDNRDAG